MPRKSAAHRRPPSDHFRLLPFAAVGALLVLAMAVAALRASSSNFLGEVGGCRVHSVTEEYAVAPVVHDFDGRGKTLITNDRCQGPITVAQPLNDMNVGLQEFFDTANGIRVTRRGNEFEVYAVGALRDAEAEVTVRAVAGGEQHFRFRFHPPDPPADFPPATMVAGQVASMDIERNSLAFQLPNGSWNIYTNNENNVNGLDFQFGNSRWRITARADADPGPRRVRVNGVERTVTIVPRVVPIGACRVESAVGLGIPPAVNDFDGRGLGISTNEECGVTISVEEGLASTNVTPARPLRTANGISVTRRDLNFSVGAVEALRDEEVTVTVRALAGGEQQFRFRFHPPDPPADFPPDTMVPNQTAEMEIGANSLTIQNARQDWIRLSDNRDNVHGLEFRSDTSWRLTVRPDATPGSRRVRVNGVEREFDIPEPVECVVVGLPNEIRQGENATIRLTGDCEPITVRNSDDGSTNAVGDVADEPRQGDGFTVVRTSAPVGTPVETEIRIDVADTAAVGNRDIVIAQGTRPFRIVPVNPGDCILEPEGRCVALVIHPGREPVCTRNPIYNDGADTAFVRRRFFEATYEDSMNACARDPLFVRAANEAPVQRPNGAGPPADDCIAENAACDAGGRLCCNPGVLHCARRAGAGADGGTFCLRGAAPGAGGGFVGGRLIAGSPCNAGAQCGVGQTGVQRLICPAVADATCCVNPPGGGNTCWDNLSGQQQFALQTYYLQILSNLVRYCQFYGHFLCPQVMQKAAYHQQIMSWLMGQ